VVGEKSRTYVFPSGRYEVAGVTGVCVRPSGSHRLQLADGGKRIVAPGWLAIEVVAESWSL